MRVYDNVEKTNDPTTMLRGIARDPREVLTTAMRWVRNTKNPERHTVAHVPEQLRQRKYPLETAQGKR
jgi:hypothetical protein